nr:Chain B, C-terminal PDZ binding motif from parathyroid hormone receptor (PTHR) [Homo sapiens]8BIA_C Chain C, Parathyroid hormone/parathyroid hormone-related peptide receptor [Homo sapiens]8BJ0_B Chain B, Parathyroid hormone/parathyroid hormone-related peptide receptor [Homo sapiens]
QEEWETVM